MKPLRTMAAASFALLLLAACGSSGLGDVFGGGGSSTSGNYEMRGTVESVDPSTRSIYLTNASQTRSSLAGSTSGNRVRIYYEDRTPVVWQGSTYRPQDLERGDQIVARVVESGNRMVANDISVTYNVSAGMTSSSSASSVVRGTVRYVDTSRRTIELDSTTWISRFNQGTGTSGRIFIQYDTNTAVDVSGRLYPVTNLEPGDIIEVNVQPSSSGSYFAQRIVLVRDVNMR
jgi:translation initiation factor IF-1